NTATTIAIADAWAELPADGDSFRLARPEFFEPDLADPIDPALFDTDDPQNLANRSLANFVEAYEIDATSGNVLPNASSIPLTQTLPAYSELRVHFDEPMAADSLLPWESFRVAFDPDVGTDTGASEELLTDVSLDASGTTASIRPVRVDAGAGT